MAVPGIPDPDRFREKFSGAMFINQFDLNDGFSHITIHPESREYLDVWTPIGLLAPVRMSQGMKQAPGLFQRAMEHNFGTMQGWNEHAAAYLDDVFLKANTHLENLQRVESFFKHCVHVKAHLNEKKMRLGYQELLCIGRMISAKGIAKDRDKIKAILDYPEPTDLTTLRRFIGMFNYQAKHVADLAREAAPLSELLKAEKVRGGFLWTEREIAKHFVELKQFSRLLRSSPLSTPTYRYTSALTLPRLD
eukprot:gb/GEZN01011101.1/.p1 GENE.gb/GEZN01011101.1/~~gb/GEZN01011101.1/.p1  ORF type:complete len:249 (+),score=25.47 gb/GEZN01011101.1/:191-937(+)